MEDIEIEYLDEYKDLVLPGIKTTDNRETTAASSNQASFRFPQHRRISSDSSGSSSIDADIFSKLFDGKFLDDELLTESSSNKLNTAQRRPSSSSSDSNDALDALYNRQSNSKIKNNRAQRLESYDSIDDLGDALMGSKHKLFPKATSSYLAQKKPSDRFQRNSSVPKSKDITDNKSHAHKASSSAVAKPKNKTDNFKPSARIKKTSSSSTSSNFSQIPIKKKSVTIIKAQNPDLNPSKHEPKKDPLNLREFLDDSDSDSSYEFESDFYGDGDTDDDDNYGGNNTKHVIDISTDSSTITSVADTVTPVVSEDEGSQHQQMQCTPKCDNERLKLYIDNLDCAETPPSKSKCKSRANSSSSIENFSAEKDHKQVNDCADQAMIETSSCTKTKEILDESEKCPRADYVDDNLTYEALERLSLNIAEQINNIDAERSIEYEKRSDSKSRRKSTPRLSLTVDGTQTNKHVRKLTYSSENLEEIESETKTNTSSSKKGRGKQEMQISLNTTKQKNQSKPQTSEKSVDRISSEENKHSQCKIETIKVVRKRGRPRKNRLERNETNDSISEYSIEQTDKIPSHIDSKNIKVDNGDNHSKNPEMSSNPVAHEPSRIVCASTEDLKGSLLKTLGKQELKKATPKDCKNIKKHINKNLKSSSNNDEVKCSQNSRSTSVTGAKPQVSSAKIKTSSVDQCEKNISAKKVSEDKIILHPIDTTTATKQNKIAVTDNLELKENEKDSEKQHDENKDAQTSVKLFTEGVNITDFKKEHKETPVEKITAPLMEEDKVRKVYSAGNDTNVEIEDNVVSNAVNDQPKVFKNIENNNFESETIPDNIDHDLYPSASETASTSTIDSLGSRRSLRSNVDVLVPHTDLQKRKSPRLTSQSATGTESPANSRKKWNKIKENERNTRKKSNVVRLQRKVLRSSKHSTTDNEINTNTSKHSPKENPFKINETDSGNETQKSKIDSKIIPNFVEQFTKEDSSSENTPLQSVSISCDSESVISDNKKSSGADMLKAEDVSVIEDHKNACEGDKSNTLEAPLPTDIVENTNDLVNCTATASNLEPSTSMKKNIYIESTDSIARSARSRSRTPEPKTPLKEIAIQSTDCPTRSARSRSRTPELKTLMKEIAIQSTDCPTRSTRSRTRTPEPKAPTKEITIQSTDTPARSTRSSTSTPELKTPMKEIAIQSTDCPTLSTRSRTGTPEPKTLMKEIAIQLTDCPTRSTRSRTRTPEPKAPMKEIAIQSTDCPPRSTRSRTRTPEPKVPMKEIAIQSTDTPARSTRSSTRTPELKTPMKDIAFQSTDDPARSTRSRTPTPELKTPMKIIANQSTDTPARSTRSSTRTPEPKTPMKKIAIKATDCPTRSTRSRTGTPELKTLMKETAIQSTDYPIRSARSRTRTPEPKTPMKKIAIQVTDSLARSTRSRTSTPYASAKNQRKSKEAVSRDEEKSVGEKSGTISIAAPSLPRKEIYRLDKPEVNKNMKSKTTQRHQLNTNEIKSGSINEDIEKNNPSNSSLRKFRVRLKKIGSPLDSVQTMESVEELEEPADANIIGTAKSRESVAAAEADGTDSEISTQLSDIATTQDQLMIERQTEINSTQNTINQEINGPETNLQTQPESACENSEESEKLQPKLTADTTDAMPPSFDNDNNNTCQLKPVVFPTEPGETTGVTTSAAKVSCNESNNNVVSSMRMFRKRAADVTEPDELAKRKQKLQAKHTNSSNTMGPPAIPARDPSTSKSVLKTEKDEHKLHQKRRIQPPTAKATLLTEDKVSSKKGTLDKSNSRQKLSKKSFSYEDTKNRGSAPKIDKKSSPDKNALAKLLDDNDPPTVNNSVIITKRSIAETKETLKQVEVPSSSAASGINISISVVPEIAVIKPTHSCAQKGEVKSKLESSNGSTNIESSLVGASLADTSSMKSLPSHKSDNDKISYISDVAPETVNNLRTMPSKNQAKSSKNEMPLAKKCMESSIQKKSDISKQDSRPAATASNSVSARKSLPAALKSKDESVIKSVSSKRESDQSAKLPESKSNKKLSKTLSELEVRFNEVLPIISAHESTATIASTDTDSSNERSKRSARIKSKRSEASTKRGSSLTPATTPTTSHLQPITEREKQRAPRQRKRVSIAPEEPQIEQQQVLELQAGVSRKRKNQSKNTLETAKRFKEDTANPATSVAFPVRITVATEVVHNEQLLAKQQATKGGSQTTDESKKQHAPPSLKLRRLCVRLNRSIVKRWKNLSPQKRRLQQKNETANSEVGLYHSNLQCSNLEQQIVRQSEPVIKSVPLPVPLPVMEIKSEHIEVANHQHTMSAQQPTPAQQPMPAQHQLLTTPAHPTPAQQHEPLATPAQPTPVQHQLLKTPAHPTPAQQHQPLATPLQPIEPMDVDVSMTVSIPTITEVMQSESSGSSTAIDHTSLPTSTIPSVENDNTQTIPSANNVNDVHTFGTTKMFSFLYPSRYQRSYGGVRLDFCCPNLDGPMQAIDPTRLHSKVEVPVLELPQFMVISTKIISKQDKNIPQKVRAKLNELTAKEALPTAVATSSTPPPTTSTPTTSTPTTTPIATNTRSVDNQALLSVGSSQSTLANCGEISDIGRLNKQLPHGLPVAISQPVVAPVSVSSLEPVANDGPQMLYVPNVCPTDKQRIALQRRVELFDAVLNNLTNRAVNMTVSERKLVIENIVKTGTLLTIDVDVGLKVLENYMQHLSIVTPPSPFPLSNVTLSSSSVSTSDRQSCPANAAVINVNTSGIYRMPVYDRDRNVIGYQQKSVNPRATKKHVHPANLAPSTSTVPPQHQLPVSQTTSASCATKAPIRKLTDDSLTCSSTLQENNAPKSKPPLRRAIRDAPAKSVGLTNAISKASGAPIAMSSDVGSNCNLYIVNQVLSQSEECILPDTVGITNATALATEIKGEVEDAEDLT